MWKYQTFNSNCWVHTNLHFAWKLFIFFVITPFLEITLGNSRTIYNLPFSLPANRARQWGQRSAETVHLGVRSWGDHLVMGRLDEGGIRGRGVPRGVHPFQFTWPCHPTVRVRRTTFLSLDLTLKTNFSSHYVEALQEKQRTVFFKTKEWLISFKSRRSNRPK